MMRFKYLIPLLLLCSTASAQRAVVVQLQNGNYIGIFYLPSGETVLLPDVQVITLPNPTTPPSPAKIDRVTYVYEKDITAVPRPVSFALRQLNDQGIIATAIDNDVVDGTGQVPEQYKIALNAAKNSAEGPCLVVQSGDKVIRVITNPTTGEQVTDAVKSINPPRR